MDVEVAVAAAVLCGFVGGAALDQDGGGFVEEGLAEGEGVLVGEVVEEVDAVVDDWAVDEVLGPAGGGGVGARREWEGVDVDEFRVGDDLEGAVEFFVGFAGEADDDVGGEGGAVVGLVEAVDHFQEVVASVLAVHAAEEMVGAGLQGEVEMGDDLFVIAEGGEEMVIEVAGFEAGEAEAEEAGDLGAECVDEITQRMSGGVGATVPERC